MDADGYAKARGHGPLEGRGHERLLEKLNSASSRHRVTNCDRIPCHQNSWRRIAAGASFKQHRKPAPTRHAQICHHDVEALLQQQGAQHGTVGCLDDAGVHLLQREPHDATNGCVVIGKRDAKLQVRHPAQHCIDRAGFSGDNRAESLGQGGGPAGPRGTPAAPCARAWSDRAIGQWTRARAEGGQVRGYSEPWRTRSRRSRS
jgi:hypothetical protein